MGRVKYSQFVDRIDIDALEEALEFDVLFEDRGNDVGHCLFPENHSHGDTTGKFAIHREDKVYNCWVCGGGSLLSLVMELKGWDSETAEAWISQFATGDTREDSEFVDDFLMAFAKDAEKRVETMPYFNDRVLQQWPYAYEWGKANGINDWAIERYEVRYNEEMMKPSPPQGKFAEDEDYVGPALVVPHRWNGRLVGWQCRWMAEDRPKWVAKWTNTTDFPANETLYGWEHLPRTEGIVIVESAKTVQVLAQYHWHAVATFGDSVSEAQMRLIRRYQFVMLAPDNDQAGQKWLRSLNDYLKRYLQVYWVPPVPGLKSDLADLAKDPATLAAHLAYAHDPLLKPQEMEWA